MKMWRGQCATHALSVERGTVVAGGQGHDDDDDEFDFD